MIEGYLRVSQSIFEVLGGKHQCSNLKDEPFMFYYEFVLIPEQ